MGTDPIRGRQIFQHWPASRVVRVFISSTFRDMQLERDHLIKFVFPELRNRCRDRQLDFVEVDLRWGITREQKAEVLPYCLDEIDQCRPFFIGILGDRYGYVPERIPDGAVRDHPWLREHREKSITELEIIHGVLRNPDMRRRTFFYFRDKAFLRRVPERLQPLYREVPTVKDIREYGLDDARRMAEGRNRKLRRLKNQIRQSRLPVRRYREPESLGSCVLNDLWDAIDRDAPATSFRDELDRETAGHDAFARSRGMGYYARPETCFRVLDRHVSGEGPPVAVFGESGIGKSALLANWVLDYRDRNRGAFVILHFIGATPGSADYRNILKRILGEIKRRYALKERLPDSVEDLRESFPGWLREASRRERIILVLDGLNQLESIDDAPALRWLPDEFPPFVRVVLSSIPGKSLDVVRLRHWQTLRVDHLAIGDIRIVIRKYLARYGKNLEDHQIDLIAGMPQSSSPLYLRALLEELRIYGGHAHLLDRRIREYLEAHTIEELFQRILYRMQQDYEKDCDGLVGDALSFLYVSPRGLYESEMRELLGGIGNPLPARFWSPFFLAIRESLVSRSGLLGFFHEYLGKAVKAKYLLEEKEEFQRRVRLSEYYGEKFSKEPEGGDYRSLSLQTAHAAVALAESSGDARLRADAYITLAGTLVSVAVGVSHDNAEKFREAGRMARKGCAIARRAKAWDVLPGGLCRRACAESEHNPDYGNYRLFDEAEAILRDRRRGGRNGVDYEGLRDVLFDKAKMAMRQGHRETFEAAMRAAREAHQNSGMDDPHWPAHEAQVWGEFLGINGKWKRAARYLEKARKRYEELKEPGGFCAATGWLGLALCRLGRYRRGVSMVHQALEKERDFLGSQEGIAKWLHQLGLLFEERGKVERALDVLFLCEGMQETQGHFEVRRTRKKLEKIRRNYPEHYQKVRRIYNPWRSDYAEFGLLWGLGPFRKYKGNPILRPCGTGWQSLAVFNPAAMTDGKRVYLLYRAEGPCPSEKGRRQVSRIGLAISEDGIHFTRAPRPVLEPTMKHEKPGGCEDPRLVRVGDTYVLTYTAYDGKIARLAMATSRDLNNWDKNKRPVFDDDQAGIVMSCRKDISAPRGWTKSGAIYPKPINGRYWMFFGDKHIFAACSRDLREWEIVHEPILSPRPGFFDSDLVEPGPPPVLLQAKEDFRSPAGLWLGYNASEVVAGKRRYAFGQALLDPRDPTRILRRCVRPLLEPTTPDEIEGREPKVVFGTGMVFFRGKWFLYYGMADTSIGVAVAEKVNPTSASRRD